MTLPRGITEVSQDAAGFRYAIATLGHKTERDIGQEPQQIGEHMVHTINESIDGSVFERWRQDENYRPANLDSWAKRKSIDPAKLHGAIRADDPSVPVLDDPPRNGAITSISP